MQRWGLCNANADPADPNCAQYAEYDDRYCVVPGVEFMARLGDAPVYRTWPESPLNVGDCEVVPVATYGVRTWLNSERFTDPPLEVSTVIKPHDRHYGDTVGIGTGAMPPQPGFTPPDGLLAVADVQAFLLTMEGPSSPSVHTTWVDLHGLGDSEAVCSVSGTPCFDTIDCPAGESCMTPPNGSPPNFILNVSDLVRILFGFDGRTYTQTPNQLDPTDCP